MAEELKQQAMCIVYEQCAFYQAGLLRDEVEIELCWRGQVPDKDYVPRLNTRYSTHKENVGSVENGVCDAFSDYINTITIARIQEVIEFPDTHVDIGKSIDSILDESQL